jgi:hypothetical protein
MRRNLVKKRSSLYNHLSKGLCSVSDSLGAIKEPARRDMMNLKILLTIVLGTMLEYFDFLLFAHFGLILTPLFFPESDTVATSILSLGLFALGFAMRPMGA